MDIKKPSIKTLLNNQQYLSTIVDRKFKNGLIAFRFYKILKQYEEELTKFRDLQNQLLKPWEGKKITEEMVEQTPELQEIEKRLNEAAEEILPDPLYNFTINDFDGVELTVKEIRALVELGILKD